MKSNKNEIVRAILLVAAVGGIMFVVLMAPNAAAVLLKPFLKGKKNITPRQSYYLSETAKRLQKQGLLTVQPNGFVKLTEKGEKELSRLEMEDYVIAKPKKWDQKYRMIIFDIPETKAKIRWAVRKQLAEWGFMKLQNSVWVNPYECEEAITLLKHRFGLNSNVLYIIADYIENDIWLKKEFKI